MSTGLIIAGLLLISEPCISFIDIIPDFIGAFLILRGISRLEAAYPSAEESAALFRKYAISSLVVTAALLPALSLCSGDPAMNMVFSLAEGVVCSVFAVSAFDRLYDAVDYISETGYTSHPTRLVRFLTKLLLISKYVLALLPQLVYLDAESGDGIYEAVYYEYAPYRPMLMVLCAAVSVAVSAVCLVFIIRFFKKLKNDDTVTKEINRAIIAAPARRGRVMRRAVFSGTALLLWAVWSAFPLELDSYPAIPYFVSALFIVTALVTLRPAVDISKREFLRVGIFAGAGAFSYVLILRYLGTHHMYEYDTAFFVTAAFYVIYLALALFASASLVGVLRQVVEMHGGEMLDSDSGSVTASVKNERFVCGLLCRISYVALAAASAAGAVSFFFQRRHPEYRTLHMAVYLVFCILASVSIGRIRQLVADRYSDA